MLTSTEDLESIKKAVVRAKTPKEFAMIVDKDGFHKDVIEQKWHYALRRKKLLDNKSKERVNKEQAKTYDQG